MHNRWYKNVLTMTYAASDEIDMSYDVLIEPVKKLKHVPIKPSQKESFGFSSVIGINNPDLLVHSAGRFLFLSVTNEDKRINKNRLNRLTAIAEREYAVKQGVLVTELSKQEIKQIRDRAHQQLLTETEPGEEYENIIIDPKLQRIFFSDANGTRVKRAVGLLQKIYPTLKVSPFEPGSIEDELTSWLHEENPTLPDEIEVQQSAVLKCSDDSRASLSKQNLSSTEIAAMISANKKVKEVAITFLNRITFRVTESLQLKGILPTETLLETVNDGEPAQTLIEDYEAHWLTQASEFTDIFNWLDRLRNGELLS